MVKNKKFCTTPRGLRGDEPEQYAKDLKQFAKDEAQKFKEQRAEAEDSDQGDNS